MKGVSERAKTSLFARTTLPVCLTSSSVHQDLMTLATNHRYKDNWSHTGVHSQTLEVLDSQKHEEKPCSRFPNVSLYHRET